MITDQRPAACRANSFFSGGKRSTIDNAAPRATASGSHVAAEYALDRVERVGRQRIVAAAAALVAAQHELGGEIAFRFARVDQRVGQFGGVAQAEVHALPGQRMHDMRGVAGQREARRDVAFREQQAQRNRDAFGRRRDVAEAEIERRAEFAAERGIVEREQAFDFIDRRRPYDRTASVAERQERERRVRQEALPRGRLVRRARSPRARRWRVARSRVRRSFDAGHFAQRGFRAIGRDDELRATATCRRPAQARGDPRRHRSRRHSPARATRHRACLSEFHNTDWISRFSTM